MSCPKRPPGSSNMEVVEIPPSAPVPRLLAAPHGLCRIGQSGTISSAPETLDLAHQLFPVRAPVSLPTQCASLRSLALSIINNPDDGLTRTKEQYMNTVLLDGEPARTQDKCHAARHERRMRWLVISAANLEMLRPFLPYVNS